MTSALTRKAGTKTSWMTSSEVIVSADRPPDGHVQLVDLPLALGMLELPHPLLADDVDVQVSSGGWAIAKYTLAPQPKMTIVMTSGITVQA